jgi:hypothetical protein
MLSGLILRRAAFASTLLLANPAWLVGQLKVTRVTAETDPAAFYSEATWGNLHGLARLTTPLVNLTFVTESGFRPAQRTEADHALPAALRLTGLRTADFQAIADAVHDAFTAELTAQGVELMPYEPLAVNPGFESLADQAPPAGKEHSAPASFQTIAGVSGGRRTVTLVGHHRPWVESFMLANYLPATRLTRELGAALPVISFLVEFVEYSSDRPLTYDWHEFLPAEQITDAPRLRARPLVYLAAGSAAFLLPDGQTATLTLTRPIGQEQTFATGLRRSKPRDREERKGGSYEVLVEPAAYRQAVIALLKPQVVMIARRLAAAAR